MFALRTYGAVEIYYAYSYIVYTNFFAVVRIQASAKFSKVLFVL